MSNINNVRRKPVTIVLGDGQEHSLKVTLNAMAELEEKFGSVDAAFEELSKGKISAIRYVLWAALLHEAKNDDYSDALTERQVGNLIDTSNIKEVMASLNKASSEDMPEDESDPTGTVIEGHVVDFPN